MRRPRVIEIVAVQVDAGALHMTVLSNRGIRSINGESAFSADAAAVSRYSSNHGLVGLEPFPR